MTRGARYLPVLSGEEGRKKRGKKRIASGGEDSSILSLLTRSRIKGEG